MSNQEKLSERAKHRLRIAGRFLRRSDHKFDGGNFYNKILGTIELIDETDRKYLKGIVDWVEEYENIEVLIDADPTRSRARKSNILSSRNGASHPAPPSAKLQHRVMVNKDGGQNGQDNM
jgi:hypothetical protein